MKRTLEMLREIYERIMTEKKVIPTMEKRGGCI